MNRFDDRVVGGVRDLRAYDPGHDLVALRRAWTHTELVELGSNENPYGCSERVRPAIEACLQELYRYPDPLGGDLKRALARSEGVAVEQILLGNGSHEILMQLGQVFAGPGDDVVMSRYGFAVYALAAQCAGARCVFAEALPRDHAMPLGHDPAALAAAVTAKTKLLFVANPNNPTGTWFSLSELEAMLAAIPASVIVVVDEAYLEFREPATGVSAAALLGDYPNLLVTRTFSKAHGLAGLRVGYALAHPELIAVMERVRESFNVNTLGLAAAEAALADAAHLERVRGANTAQRAALALALRERGFDSLPSQTNFLLVHFGADCARIEQHLLAAGVVPRPMGGYGLREYLRITIGREQDNQRLLQALDSWETA